MNLVELTPESIAIGRPLPYALRDQTGVLLARRGFIIGSRDDLNAMRGRGSGFYIDVTESDKHQKAFVGKLYDLVRDDRPLGQIADAKLTTRDLDASRDARDAGMTNWMDIQVQGTRLLRELHPDTFADELDRLHARLQEQCRRNPDGTLFALFYLSSREVRYYSATHAMLVASACVLAAREVLGWPEDQITTLCKAAMTMNIAMTALQDGLAAQIEPPVAEQRRLIAAHPARGAELLHGMGLSDPDWLEAVRDHHSSPAGDLAERTTAQRMARLIQRADMFVARIAPRASRRAQSHAAAMQACYFDENRAIDEAGAALIKAVGVYAPGSLVRLVNHEVGMVVRRGANTTSPRVALVQNRDGYATGEYLLRDSSQRALRVAAQLAPHDCKVEINLEKMLALTASPTLGRML